MKEWKDRKRHYGDDEPNASEARYGRFKLIVHRHINYSNDQWLASSPYLIDCAELKSKDLAQAKTQAKAMLQVILQDAIDEIVPT